MSYGAHSYRHFPDDSPQFPWLIVVAVLLVALLIFVAVTINAGSGVAPARSPEAGIAVALAENPELRVMERWRLTENEARQQALLHESPELALVERCLGENGQLNCAFLAQNPEVGLFLRQRAANR